jgi:hypothetical protein
MPDAGGKLSENEKTAIREKIEKLWIGGGKNCPICGSNRWVIADHLVEPEIARGWGGVHTGPIYPMVMLVSEPCGYTMLFNAATLGVVSRYGG